MLLPAKKIAQLRREARPRTQRFMLSSKVLSSDAEGHLSPYTPIVQSQITILPGSIEERGSIEVLAP